MQEALKSYLALATGLTEVSKKRAKAAAKKLAKSGGATVEQVQSLTEDLLATRQSNREAMVRLVRYEIDRALGKVGLATADEVEQLNARVRQLEQQVRDAERAAAAASPTIGTEAAPAAATLAKTTAAKTTAAKAKATKTTGAKPVKTTPAKSLPAKGSPAKPAKSSPAKVTPAKTSRKAPAKSGASASTRKATTTRIRANGSAPTGGADT
ncbi:MAG TPA: hypothetical protein VGR21_01015 [Cryptosporangiaceae bacterium]|nr:hypothetical protein [Cryptosporangiaceae bacterium]